jgi:hypothetical protein
MLFTFQLRCCRGDVVNSEKDHLDKSREDQMLAHILISPSSWHR